MHIILLAPVFLNAQVNIVNRSLTDSTLNIAYIGVDNAIELIGLKNSNSSIVFSTTNGGITKQRQDRYVLRPQKEGECTITFTEKGKLIAKKTFNINTAPDPMARFSNLNDTIKKGETTYLKISLNRLINDPTLRVYMPKSFLKDRGHILSYRITYDGLSFEDQEEILVTGSRLTDEQVKKITKIFSRSNFMYVDQIRCIFADGRMRLLSPLSCFVTN